MGPIAAVEAVSFWPPSRAHVQPVQELAPPPPSFWPIAHFPLDFSPNPPYNPPYAPLRYYLNYRQAGHGFLIWSALKVYLPRAAPRPAKRSRAAASERRPAARRLSRARLSAPQSLYRDSCLPVPWVPPSSGSGRSQLPAWRACRGTPLSMRAAAWRDARPLQVGSVATWRRAGRAAGGRGGVRSPGSGLAAMRAPGRAEGASGGGRSRA